MEILLNSAERIAIVSLATGIVILTLILVLCFILRGCPLHSYLEEAEMAKNGVITERASLTHYSKDSLTPASYKLSQQRAVSPSNRDSTYSSMSEDSRASSPVPSSKSSLRSSFASRIQSLSNEKLFGNPVNDNKFAGTLCYSLQYICEDGINGKLLITISEARDLRPRDTGEGINPFFRIQIFKSRRSIRGVETTSLADFLTHEAKRTRNPIYNQGFYAEVPLIDFKDIVIYIKFYNKDKHCNPTLMGQITQPMNELKSLIEKTEKLSLTNEITQYHENNGEIYFGMSYLPTAQRLSVSIIKAHNLEYRKLTDCLSHFNCFVRVILLGAQGRVLKRQKTSRKYGTASPQYNETLIFDLKVTQLEHITLLVVVTMRMEDEDSSTITSEDSEVNVDALNHNFPSKKTHKDVHLGKTLLGKDVMNEVGRQHWIQMLDNPRKVITMNYVLN